MHGQAWSGRLLPTGTRQPQRVPQRTLATRYVQPACSVLPRRAWHSAHLFAGLVTGGRAGVATHDVWGAARPGRAGAAGHLASGPARSACPRNAPCMLSRAGPGAAAAVAAHGSWRWSAPRCEVRGTGQVRGTVASRGGVEHSNVLGELQGTVLQRHWVTCTLAAGG